MLKTAELLIIFVETLIYDSLMSRKFKRTAVIFKYKYFVTL